MKTEFDASAFFTEIRHLDNRREGFAPLDKSYSCVTHDAHRKLAFSTLAHDTLRIIPLAAGVVTTLHTTAKNSVRKLIDYTAYTWTIPDGKSHNVIVHILINMRWHLSILNVQSFKGADCVIDHYMMIAKVRERLSVRKEEAQEIDVTIQSQKPK